MRHISLRLGGSLAAACVACLLSGTSAQGRERPLRFDHLTVEDGLSNSWVRSILKDRRGFLWVGTQDGLDRFDGERFTIYRHDPNDPESPATQSVTALLEDSRQRLWIGGSGLQRYDSQTGRPVSVLPKEGSGTSAFDAIRHLAEGRDGQLWIATETGGLFRFDPEKSTVAEFTHDPNDPATISHNAVMAVVSDPQSRIWIGSRGGLDRYDEGAGRFARILPRPSDPPQARRLDVERLCVDKDGTLWLGTMGQGLVHFDPRSGRLRQYRSDPGDPTSINGDRILSLMADGQGLVYVGLENRGLDVLDSRTGVFTHHLPRPEDPGSLASAAVWSLLLDDQGTLWAGTFNGGVDYSSPYGKRFGLIAARDDGLSDPHVAAVIEDRRADLWIGTDGGGLFHLARETGRFTHYVEGPANAGRLGSNAVLALAEDEDGQIWIGTWRAGLHRLDPRTGRFDRFLYDPTLTTGNNVRAVTVDARGRVLAGTENNGVQVFDRRTQRFTSLSALYPGATADGSVSVIVEDARGNLWLGGRFGAQYVDQASGTVTSYERDSDGPRGLGQGDVQAIRVDSRGKVWIGVAGGGLILVQGLDVVRRYGTADGLPSGSVKGILEDARGNLWLSTSRGLVRFEAGIEAPSEPRLMVFDVHDGLQGAEFNNGAAFRCESGEMLFGGQRGLNYFRPEEIEPNPHVPPVVLTGLRVFNTPQVAGAKDSVLPRPLSELDELTVSYRESMLTFEFAALSYVLPQKNQYAYKLEGFDDKWVQIGTQHAATYTSLKPDSYVLRVKGSNNDGVWNEEGVALRLNVTPPIWRTLWFLSGAALLVLSVLVYVYRLRVRAIHARRRELEALVAERTADLSREIGERSRAEQEAREYAEKLAGSNVELLEKQEAVENENRERRRAEEETRRSAEKLGQANDELIEKQRALERENEERRRAEEAAGRERDLLHALMDNIPDHIYFKDADSRFTRVNAAHAASLGLASAEEVVGKTDADFFPAEFAQAAREDERRLMETGEPMLGKTEHDQATGRWFLATKVPTRDPSGQVTGLVGISKDITERREAEERLQRGLEAFLTFASAVAEGDLTRRAEEGQETLGQIAEAVNRILDRFVEILTEVRDAAFSVSSASSEILAASTQIAKGAQFGRDRVHATSSAVEEMVASLGQVSKSAEESASAAQQVFEHLSASDRAVQATAQGMSRIDGAVSETAEKMRLLGVRSGEVFEIIDLIEEIASRSELLSMNAAIEAAHAGDAGRGFGVVADEIRNLSERSTEAIRSVTAIVKGMSTEMQAVLAAMETSTREVKLGLDLSEQARRGLSEISVIVQRATDLAGEISGATREQTSASQTVSEAMQLIANITEQSTAGSNETARAVRDLVSLSEHLTAAISRFRIDAPEELSAVEGDRPQTVQALGEVARQLARVAERLEPEPGAPSPPAAEAAEAASKDAGETRRGPAPARDDIVTLVKRVGEIIGRLSRPS